MITKFVLILFLLGSPVRNYVMTDKFACKEAMDYNNSRLKYYGMHTACMPLPMFEKTYGVEYLGEEVNV